ncbi:hypothetical protein SNEBB_007892 [Seison nebaliae]|nr:hypothetical protein SNEBB_007892 [Seison nebaliae]
MKTRMQSATTQYIELANNKKPEGSRIKSGDVVRKKITLPSIRGEQSKKLKNIFSQKFIVRKIFDNNNVRIETAEEPSRTEIVHCSNLVKEVQQSEATRRSSRKTARRYNV